MRKVKQGKVKYLTPVISNEKYYIDNNNKDIPMSVSQELPAMQHIPSLHTIYFIILIFQFRNTMHKKQCIEHKLDMEYY